MIVFPNSKINLGLRIIRKRTDGFHDLETVFYPIPMFDIMELVRDAGYGMRDDSSITFSGIKIDSPGDNLCVRAYLLLKRDYPQLPAVKIHLHKAIPMGAGLGGGSADAAFTLKMLNEKFDLGLTNEQLSGYALQLGSDCPFFIINQACYATGRGEILETLSLDLKAYKFVIVNPNIHISTTKAFSGISPTLPVRSVKEIIQQPIHSWKHELINDFENMIFQNYPEIEAIKTLLYDKGAVYASMSGSGSTVYGIFEKNNQVLFQFPSHYFYRELTC